MSLETPNAFADEENILLHTALFKQVSPAEAEELLPHLKHATFDKGDYIFSEGDTDQRMYLLEQGRVKLIRTSSDDRVQLLSIHAPGEVLGEIPVFDPHGGPRTASAVSMSHGTRVVWLEHDALFAWLDEHPRVAIDMLQVMANRQRGNKVCMVLQDICACALSFLHGAQDGQKFMSIFMLAIMMTAGMGMDLSGAAMPMWLMIFCAFNMGLGTAVGGERIIKSVGMDMVKLEAFQGFAASLSTFVSLMLATFGGLPVSTTHTNTTAIMGVGAAKNPKSVKWSIAIDMVKTWVLTFPGCGILGFACAKLFLMIL